MFPSEPLNSPVVFPGRQVLASRSSRPGAATAELGGGHASRQPIAAAEDPGPGSLAEKMPMAL